MKWACSLLAVNDTMIRHAVMIVEASSRDEAVGKGHRAIRRLYNGDWRFDVEATEADGPAIDPDRITRPLAVSEP